MASSEFLGLDLRTNKMDRVINSARDCSNLHLNETNILEKRNNFNVIPIPKSNSADPNTWADKLPLGSNIIDHVQFNDEYILFVILNYSGAAADFSNHLYKFNSSTLEVEVIPFNNSGGVDFPNAGWGAVASVGFDGKVTSFEKNGCLYFQSSSNSDSTDQSSGTPLMGVYDGKIWSFAGVPQVFNFGSIPAIPPVKTSGGYISWIPFKVDNNGNFHYGNVAYSEENSDSATLNMTIPFAGSSPNEGFNDLNRNFVDAPMDSGGSVTLTAGTDPITNPNVFEYPCALFAGTIGQILYDVTPTGIIYRYEVTAFDGTTITLSNSEFLNSSTLKWEPTLVVDFLNTINSLSSVLMAVYSSKDFTAEYKFVVLSTGARPLATGADIAVDLSVIPNNNDYLPNFLEDFYDVNSINFNPPPGIQVREYGEAAILADSNNLYFSNLAIQGTVESFAAFDNFPVGEQEKGEIKSFFSNQNFIAVFRENDSYLISGNIFTGNFRVQNYRITGVGGTSPHGVIEVDGQCLVSTNRGPRIALENGDFAKVGDRIEPIFTENALQLALLSNTAEFILDAKRERIYLFYISTIPSESIVLVYDYRNKRWFKYDDILAFSGMSMTSFGEMTYILGANLYLEKQTSASSTEIAGYYYSNYSTMGEPSLKKRFKRIGIHNSTLAPGQISVNAKKDWSSQVFSSTTLNFDNNLPFDINRITSKLAYSFSFELVSPVGSFFKADGLYIDIEVEQYKEVDSAR